MEHNLFQFKTFKNLIENIVRPPIFLRNDMRTLKERPISDYIRLFIKKKMKAVRRSVEYGKVSRENLTFS
jgi:hypothetical protein